MLLKHLQNLLKTMVSAAHKYSANEDLATFILASDRGDESSLESSDKYDSELRIFVIFLLSVNFFKVYNFLMTSQISFLHVKVKSFKYRI